MSKTKGNVIDPIEIIHQYGTDAVRFTLASMASPGTDIAFSEARTEGYRAFANKIWNAARFIFMQMERAKEAGIIVDLQNLDQRLQLPDDAPLEARWIVSRLNTTAERVNQALSAYRFDDAANLIYQFFWGEFCDWYLEVVKIRLDFSEAADKSTTACALATLLGVFEAALRLLSPFMPFLTEEVWHAFYDGKAPLKSIALAVYPVFDTTTFDQRAEVQMMMLQHIIIAIRARRKELGIEEKIFVPVKVIDLANMITHKNNLIDDNLSVIQRLAKVSAIELVQLSDTEESGKYATIVWFPAGPTDIFIDYEKPIDMASERERLGKDLAKFKMEMESKQTQLQNEAFLAKAPVKVVDGLRARAGELTALIEKAHAALRALESLEPR
jgi:valyl-tRNA synthetase